MEEEGKAIRAAARENWATYMPTPLVLLTGVLAALFVMLSPGVMYAVVSIVAFIGELFRQGRPDFYITFYVNMRSFAYYVQLEWSYIIAGTALGLPLAYLRQRHGFYKRHVRGNQYRYHIGGDEGGDLLPMGRYRRKWMLPIYPHRLILWVSGPVMLLGMALHADPDVYPQILYNMFAVWLTSGLVAQILWEYVQIGLLRLAARWWGGPRRNLVAEYQLKRIVEDDPALSYYSVWDVEVDVKDGLATVYGNITGTGALKRLDELSVYIDGVNKVRVLPQRCGADKRQQAAGSSSH